MNNNIFDKVEKKTNVKKEDILLRIVIRWQLVHQLDVLTQIKMFMMV